MTEVVNKESIELRFGSWGPGYLLKGKQAAYGIVTLRSGDEFANHYHERHEETFFVLEGRFELWLDRSERLELQTGDLVRCPAGVQHYLRNVTNENASALFVKAPNEEFDKIDLQWSPLDVAKQ